MDTKYHHLVNRVNRAVAGRVSILMCPEPNAGSDQNAFIGNTVALDGGGGSDPDNGELAYIWSLVNIPANSAAALPDPGVVSPVFTIDEP